jgi:folate-dependent phosphoribosylglycinamide formyltransferase PurN
VLPCDTVALLAARVLTQEHLLYPRVVKDFLRRPIG